MLLGGGALGFSMHGQGGGVLYTPVQLLFGVPYHTAVLQSQWFTLLTAGSALYHFRRARTVDWRLAFALAASSCGGAFLSGYYARRFPSEPLTVLLAVLVGASAVAMALDMQPRPCVEKRSPWDWLRRCAGQAYRINLAWGLPLSFLVGVSAGLTGAAGGFLMVPMLVRLFGVPIAVAFGSSALMVALNAAGGLLGQLSSGAAVWHEPLLLSLCVAAGSQIGPRLSFRSSPRTMKRRFAFYLFVLALLLMTSVGFAPARS